MNLQIINSCAGTDPGLPTAVTDPDRRYKHLKTKEERFLITFSVEKALKMILPAMSFLGSRKPFFFFLES